jgi:hypothetical protein
MISRDTLYIEWLSVNIYGVNRINSLIDMALIVLIARNILVVRLAFKRLKELIGTAAVIRRTVPEPL